MYTKTYRKSVDWRIYTDTRSPISSSPSLFLQEFTVKSYTDSVELGDAQKDWRGKIRRLESATTSLSGIDRQHLSGSRFSLFNETIRLSDGRRSSFSVYGDIASGIGEPNGTNATIARANNRALMQFVKRSNDELRQLQALVSFGELGETLRMIRNPLKSVFTDLRRYLSTVTKRGQKRANRKHLSKIISDTWLEYSFGWSPLLSDVEDAAKALARYTTYSPPHKVVTGKGGDQNLLASSIETKTYGRWQMRRIIRDEEETTVRYRGCIKTAHVPFSGDLAPFGINLTELAPTLWELIPYSFLVDYFTNAGNIIAGASFNRASVAWIEKGSETKLTRSAEFDSAILTGSPGPGIQDVSKSISPGSKAQFQMRSISRSNYTSGSLIPDLEFGIPGLGLQWLNMAALLGSSRAASRRLARLG